MHNFYSPSSRHDAHARNPEAPWAPGAIAGLVTAADDVAALRLARDRQHALGLFLRHLAAGEVVAQRSAWLQSRMAPAPRAARFFSGQARHEGLHARLFDWFAARLGAPSLQLSPCPYAAYQAELEVAAGSGLFLNTVVGTQVVLEALGEALLARLDLGLTRAGAGFTRLRRMIRRQEEAHHAFGNAMLAGMLQRGETDTTALRALAQPYVLLADTMINSGSTVLTHFALTPQMISADFRALLPAWSRGSA